MMTEIKKNLNFQPSINVSISNFSYYEFSSQLILPTDPAKIRFSHPRAGTFNIFFILFHFS